MWDGFFLHSLLLEHSERGTVLELAHDAHDQAERLQPALEARNNGMVGPGQELWNHACDLCCEIRENATGGHGKPNTILSLSADNDFPSSDALRATVCDGVCIGHPCCGEHDCKYALHNQRLRFCDIHAGNHNICAVTTCTSAIDPGFQTCRLPHHRQLEDVGSEERGALFQLRKRLDRINTSHVENSLQESSATEAPPASDEAIEVDEQGTCDGKSPEGNTKPRARFGRRRTHNEQLCVTTCGVILGRATFFGSEGTFGVLVRSS